MRKLIFAIVLLLGCLTSVSSLGSFKEKEVNKTKASAPYLGESDRMEDLSDRIDLTAYIDDNYIEDGEMDDDSDIIYTDTSNDEHFKVAEFVEYDPYASKETIRKIKEVHIPELAKVRDKIGEPVIIRSAARSVKHELAMGRSGKSKHVYSNGLGAVDISTINYTRVELDSLEDAVIDTTKYNRIARYDTFIHLDFADNRFGGRAYYRNTKHGWIYIGKIKQK